MALFDPDFTLENLILGAAEAVRPAQRMTVAEAAEAYRKINNPGSYVGPWLNDTTPYLVEPMNVLQSQRYTGMVFAGPAQCGKALALDTVIPTPSGWTTMGRIEVGDLVLGSNGHPCRVTAATPVMHNRKCFEIVFKNGERVIADADHNWAVFPSKVGLRDAPLPTVMKTVEMISSEKRYSIPRFGYSLPTTDLPLDPYVLGAWLGDGHKYGARIYAHVDDAPHIRKALGIETRFHVDGKGLGVIALSPERHNPGAVGGRAGISKALGQLGMGAGEAKRIPLQYQRAGDAQRLALLQGLLDTDGHATTAGQVEFSTACPDLARDFRDLCFGLGYTPRERGKNNSYLFRFAPHGDERLFRLERKQRRLNTGKKRRPIRSFRVAVETITEVPSAPVRCITVDDLNHLYMFGTRGNLTHNTDMFSNWLGYSAKCDPADMMLIQTSRTTSRDFSMRRVDRLHRHSPEIGEMLAPSAQSDNTFDKMYTSGMMLTLSWPAINELSGRPIPRLWLTDFDRMSMDVDGEGNPFDLARKRATTFRSHGMCVAESSPGFVVDNPKWVRKTNHEAPPTQGVLALYNRGDRRRFYWFCHKCARPFEPNFNLLQWPKSTDMMESAEAAMMNCPHCGHAHPHDRTPGNASKFDMNIDGLWLPDNCQFNEDREVVGTPLRSTIASFWLKGVAAAFSDWKTLVFNYLSAEAEYQQTGSEESLKTTVNTDQGEAYTPKQLANTRVPEELKSRAKPLGMKEVPPGVRFLIATIDVQQHRFVVQVHGVYHNGDRVVIDRFDIRKSKRADDEGDPLWVKPGAHPEDWKLIGEGVLAKTYPLSDGSGRRMAIWQTFSDSAGSEGFTANAYNFVRWLRKGNVEEPDEEFEADEAEADEGTYDWDQRWAGRFMLLKGASTITAPRIKIDYPDSQRKDRHAGARGEIPVLFINTFEMKNQLNNRLDRDKPGGRVIFPDWLDDNFYIELTVEVRDPVKGWLNPKNYRNESWDLLAYLEAALLTPQVRFDHINWQDPPVWAMEWDMNDLVFDPEISDKPVTAEKKTRSPLGKLASNLA